MEVYLIRHTTPDISKEVCYGQSDIPVATTFNEEHCAVVDQLPATLEVVYTSPLKRCLQLAQRVPHDKLIQSPGLMEMNFGDWEMKRWSDIPKGQLDPWMSNFVAHQVPGGESMEMLAKRVCNWFEQLQLTGFRKVAVVTHAGPIRVLLSKVRDTPLGEAFQHYTVGYGEVIRLG